MYYVRLIATKSNRYGTRHIEAGQEFEIADGFARTLLLVGLATPAVVEPPPPTTVPDDLERLRGDARGLGIKVDQRWGVKRLQAEIDLNLEDRGAA